MKKRSEENGTVEMPVTLALMIASSERATAAFDALSPERRNEYIRRAAGATSVAAIGDVVRDIVTVG